MEVMVMWWKSEGRREEVMCDVVRVRGAPYLFPDFHFMFRTRVDKGVTREEIQVCGKERGRGGETEREDLYYNVQYRLRNIFRER